MRKVICIHQGAWPTYDFEGRPIEDTGPNPSYLETVTVIGTMNICNTPCYKLAEYDRDIEGDLIYYEQKYFAIPADITELTEILEQQPEHA